MAKSDFCFTFYDGDAARDMQHMDRLTRGGYIDFIISQRKFGRLSLDFVKRILGKDFSEIWPQIEIVCSQDENQRYYLEWLERSEAKAKSHSAHQSENGKHGGRPKNQNPTKTQPKPNGKPTETQMEADQNPVYVKKKPLEDGNGDGNGIEYVNGFGKSENLFEKKFKIEDCLRIAMLDPRWVKANKATEDEVLKFNSYLEKLGIYEFNPMEYKSYFGKLKGKYPSLLVKEYSVDELRELSKKIKL
jgi:hypothetical protein